MQFAIGSNLRHMSDKVSIFNAAHPCFLKCILRYETSSTWLYLSKSVANDVLRKEISFLHQICIMREEFSREKNLLPKLLQNKWLLGELTLVTNKNGAFARFRTKIKNKEKINFTLPSSSIIFACRI